MTQFYGQYGEDQWIVEHLSTPSAGFFVDVGAGNGTTCSNTRMFEERGWQGLCIDADPRSYLTLVMERRLAYFSAIRSFEGVTHVFLNDEMPDFTRVTGTIGTGRTIPVPCVPLGVLLQRLNLQRHIDLLSVDVEGIELEVLQSFDIASDYPSIIIVEYETLGMDEQRDQVLTFFQPLPYTCVHQTRANLIFQRR